ncbi:MAG: hypothetical protein ACLPQ6_05910 [Steroidobacteraceae bacterium]|jgi:hypothetical protein
MNDSSRRSRSRWVGAVLAGAALLLVLFAVPHHMDLTETVALPADLPRILEVDADRADITIVLSDARQRQLTIEGVLRGFGLLTSRFGVHLETSSPPAPVLRYSLEARGWLVHANGFATLQIPAAAFERVRVWVRRGDIHVVDATRAGVVRTGLVELQLTTGQGTVERSARPPVG